MTTETEILASGTAAAQSDTQEATSGQVHSLILHPTSADNSVVIEALGSGGQWRAFGFLNLQQPVRQVYGPLSYRVNRPLQSGACSVDRVTD